MLGLAWIMLGLAWIMLGLCLDVDETLGRGSQTFAAHQRLALPRFRMMALGTASTSFIGRSTRPRAAAG